MNKKLLAAVIGVLLVVGLSGCGTSKTANQSMDNMKMDSKQPLMKAFMDELNGFTTIEQDIKKGDYKNAATIANNLHDEFHAVILPPLKAKKGANYAENIHGKYDELQDAINGKNNVNIEAKIKLNRDNLHTIAGVLGVTIK